MLNSFHFKMVVFGLSDWFNFATQINHFFMTKLDLTLFLNMSNSFDPSLSNSSIYYCLFYLILSFWLDGQLVHQSNHFTFVVYFQNF